MDSPTESSVFSINKRPNAGYYLKSQSGQALGVDRANKKIVSSADVNAQHDNDVVILVPSQDNYDVSVFFQLEKMANVTS
jgi:hypothetical protein